jgi:orotidine-5'-phosphate decarboxylase
MKPSLARERLIAALDWPSAEEAVMAARGLRRSVGLFKVGLELFTAAGPSVVRALAKIRPVFLDLKLHDIPNTMSAAAEQAALLGASMLSVHASAGRAGIEAAVAGAARGSSIEGPPPAVLAVTVLTSLNHQSLRELGLNKPPKELVLDWAQLSLRAGAAGLVCSVRELASLRKSIGSKPLLVVPGIRLAGAAPDDQHRTGTPADAIRAGADYLVVGRPLRQAPDPRKVAQAIEAEIAAALPAR